MGSSTNKFGFSKVIIEYVISWMELSVVILSKILFFSLRNYRCEMGGNGKEEKESMKMDRSAIFFLSVEKGGKEWERVE